jgi:hypothetical protein
MRDRVYKFHFEKPIVLRRPLWVYVTSALSVACAIAAVVARLAWGTRLRRTGAGGFGLSITRLAAGVQATERTPDG